MGTSSLTAAGPNPTTGDIDLNSPSPFGEENDRRCNPDRDPKFTLWLKLNPVAGIDEIVGEFTGPVTVPVDVEVN